MNNLTNNAQIYKNLSPDQTPYCTMVEPERGLFFEDKTPIAFDFLTIQNQGLLITGDNGVGKTAFVKHLQWCVFNYNCPRAFNEANIVELKQLDLCADIKQVSDYESRLTECFNNIMKRYIERNQITVLYIDDINEFLNDINVNVLLNQHLERALRNNIKVVCGCKTRDLKHIQKSYNLFRHFNQLNLKEPSLQQTYDILTQKMSQLEMNYRVVLSPEILTKVINLSDKYIRNEFMMPKKAMKVVEYMCSMHHNNSLRKLTTTKINEITALKDKINEMLLSSDPDKRQLLKYNEALEDGYAYIRNISPVDTVEDLTIKDEDVWEAVSVMAGIPISSLSQSETDKLQHMEQHISKVVIGQEEAVDMVCKTIKRNRLGIRKKNHTVGNFIFLGTTGVGKTFLAKKLAEYIFGSENNMIRLDMAEYVDEISVNKLIGAPPGYVGYGEGGVLCNAIRNNPYSIILFDEIEKAHPSIFNTILQLLDEGYITDSNGVKISANNTIIILTSNTGVKEAKESGGAMGFYSSQSAVNQKVSDNQKKIIEKSIQKTFSPEFLNRIDSICYFRDLGEVELAKIFDNEIEEVSSSLADLGYTLTISKKVKDYLVKVSAEEKMGARALIRNINNKLSNEITDLIISTIDKNKTKVKVDMKEEGVMKVTLK